MVVKIEIGNQLPVQTYNDQATIDWWRRNGKINTALLERVRLSKYGTNETGKRKPLYLSRLAEVNGV